MNQALMKPVARQRLEGPGGLEVAGAAQHENSHGGKRQGDQRQSGDGCGVVGLHDD